MLRSLSLLLLALSSLPATVISSATGASLAGGTVTAFWADSTSQVFIISVIGSATGSGRINQPGAFNFNIDNSTLDNVWSITNNRASNLVRFTIDLTSAINGTLAAVFDSGATPLAVGSPGNVQSAYGGTQGVRAVSGGTIGSFAFLNQHLGDGGANIFRALRIDLAGSGLGQGATFAFNADSDLSSTVVPESSLWLPTVGLLVVGLWRRRR